MPATLATAPVTPVVDQATAPEAEFAMSDLRRGARGRIARVLGETSDALRLKALGMCEGREVEVLRTGDAWVVRVLGSRIGLSHRLAASVLLVAA